MAYIDIHVLQTVPPSNLNRDETGSPKTGTFGGVRRARVSSQAWKRAAREHFNRSLDAAGIGYRTARIVQKVAEEIRTHGVDQAVAEELAAKVLTVSGISLKEKPKAKAKKPPADDAVAAQESAEDSGGDFAVPGALVFISARQIVNLAAVAIAAHTENRAPTKKEAVTAFARDHSFDVALFGRMVANASDLVVDAAAQVAHAISVDPVETEFDYFTAVDDVKDAAGEKGAAHIGTLEFNSSTLYRYATLNLDQLELNLGDRAATARAASAFVDAFIRSMPTGKQNTFANRTAPSAVVVVIRDDQPVNLSGAFEEPVRHVDGTTIAATAADQLAHYGAEIAEYYGPAAAAWVSAPRTIADRLEAFGTVVPLAELVDAVERHARGTVAVPA
jgi:CRISPR system Cascade subunit CasC